MRHHHQLRSLADTEYRMKKHPVGRPDQGRSTINPTTKWQRRRRRYLRILLINALRGAAYTVGGTAVTWLIWWVQLR